MNRIIIRKNRRPQRTAALPLSSFGHFYIACARYLSISLKAQLSVWYRRGKEPRVRTGLTT
jgi:hypothetical protein